MAKNLVIYPVIFENDGDYIMATVPDIGHSTEGDSMINAVAMAENLIGITLEAEISFPEPTDIRDIKLTDDQIIAYVSVDMDAYRRKYSKTVRKNVTIPEYLNKMAKEQQINVSQLLTEALHKTLNA
jgi:antitoxin HicB